MAKGDSISFPRIFFKLWQKNLRPPTFLVLLSVYNLLEEKGLKPIEITIEEFKESSGLSGQSIQKSLIELEEFNLITRKKVYKNRVNCSYTIELTTKLKETI